MLGLALTALAMGAAGSPHCVAMCGAATTGIGRTPSRLLAFQVGRVAGYAILGAMVASSVQLLQWGATQATVLKPFWAMFHVAVIVFGLSLVWLGRQPAWLDRWSHRVWQAVRGRTLGLDTLHWPAVAGLLWALLPCGLLYSALVVAALASNAWQGAAVMAAFAIGSAVSLQIAPTLWRRCGGPASGAWAVRLAGVAVAAASVWALSHGLWAATEAAVC